MADVAIRFETSQAKRATKDLASDTKKLQEAVRGSQSALEKQGRAAGAAAAGTTKFGASAKLAAPGVRALGAAVKAALGPVGLLLSAAGAMTQAFQVLSQQDFAEAKVRSLGVNSKELVGRLKGVSNELQGQASVVDLTSAAYDVASAGFTKAADAAGILKAASQGATGGFSDINTVGDAATSVLNAYGLEADKAAKLVDGFIQTQNDGKIVIGQYAANIAKVAPVAAALGVPLEEVNAAVAQITAGGQGAEVTFTALKTAFAQVAAGKVGDEFKKLGVDISASTLKSDGLAGTLEKIKKSGADAGTVIKAFGTEAGPSILALLNDTEKFNKLLENQKNSQGAAAKAAFEAADTIQGSIKRLQTAFQNLFADGSELGVLLKSTFKVAAVTVEFLAAVVRNTVAPFRAIIAAVTQIGAAISQALGMDGVNVAFELEKAYRGFLDTLGQISDFIIGLGVRFGEFIGGMVSGIKDGVANIKRTLVDGFTGAFNKIASVVQSLYNKLPGPVRFILEKAAKLISAVGGAAQQVAGQAITAVTGFVGTTVEAGRGFSEGGGTTPQQQAANGIVPTGGALGGGANKDADKEAEKAERIAQASADRVLSLQNQTLLASALNQEERQQFERQIRINELLQNKKGLTDEQIKAELDALTGLFVQQDATKQLLDDQKKLADQAKKRADQEKQAAENLNRIYQGIGQTITNGVVDAIKGAIDGTKSLGEVGMGILKDIANQMLSSGIQMLLSSITGPAGSIGGFLGKIFGGGKASGGTVKGGTSYLVGEKGPELFTPGRTGSIAPNSSLGGANVTVNVDASGTTAEGDEERSKQLGQALGAAVQAELIKQQRPGGLLAR